MTVYTFDSWCLDLARHFLPTATDAVLNELAQEIQDTVERFDAEPDEPPVCNVCGRGQPGSNGMCMACAS